MPRLFRDGDALAFDHGECLRDESTSQHVNHINKRNKKKRGVEVVFDPAGHKEFVTGFRRRKLQRRKEALMQAKKKEKEQKRETKAERRAKLKETLGLPDDYGITSSSDSEVEKQKKSRVASVNVYKTNPGTTTTVTTIPLTYEDDSEVEETVTKKLAVKTAKADVSKAQKQTSRKFT